MARNGNRNGNNGEAEIAAPEGFGINVGRERGEGWVKKEKGNEVMARIIGRHSYKNRQGKMRAYYQLKLLKPCKVEIDDPESDEDDVNAPRVTVMMEAGKIVNLDETAKFADLESYTKNGGTYDVWFVYGAKKDIGNGQTMWDVTGPKLRVVHKPSETPDQIPF